MPIYLHSHNVLDTFGRKAEEYEDGQLYFGLELECIDINSGCEDSILKQDASCGYEIVTLPMTIDKAIEWVNTHRSQINLLDIDNTCGMHVHLTRSYFKKDPKALDFFLTFFNQNEKYISKECGRKPNKFCKIEPKDKGKQFVDTFRFGGCRYRAINLLSANTIEVRSFSSTDNPDEIISRLEWLNNLITFCFLSKIRSTKWEAFQYWLDKGKPSEAAYLDSLNKVIKDLGIEGLNKRAIKNIKILFLRSLYSTSPIEVSAIKEALYCNKDLANQVKVKFEDLVSKAL